jgi:hypothetical protein
LQTQLCGVPYKGQFGCRKMGFALARTKILPTISVNFGAAKASRN